MAIFTNPLSCAKIAPMTTMGGFDEKYPSSQSRVQILYLVISALFARDSKLRLLSLRLHRMYHGRSHFGTNLLCSLRRANTTGTSRPLSAVNPYRSQQDDPRKLLQCSCFFRWNSSPAGQVTQNQSDPDNRSRFLLKGKGQGSKGKNKSKKQNLKRKNTKYRVKGAKCKRKRTNHKSQIFGRLL